MKNLSKTKNTLFIILQEYHKQPLNQESDRWERSKKFINKKKSIVLNRSYSLKI